MNYNLQSEAPYALEPGSSTVYVGHTSVGDPLFYSNDKLCTITQPYVTNDIPKTEFDWSKWSDWTTSPMPTQAQDKSEKDSEYTQSETVVKSTHDPVNHPSHYTYGKIETIDYIEDKGQGFNLGNAVKYISRAGHKYNTIEDLEKAIWYINREIMRLKKVNQDGDNPVKA